MTGISEGPRTFTVRLYGIGKLPYLGCDERLAVVGNNIAVATGVIPQAVVYRFKDGAHTEAVTFCRARNCYHPCLSCNWDPDLSHGARLLKSEQDPVLLISPPGLSGDDQYFLQCYHIEIVDMGDLGSPPSPDKNVKYPFRLKPPSGEELADILAIVNRYESAAKVAGGHLLTGDEIERVLRGNSMLDVLLQGVDDIDYIMDHLAGHPGEEGLDDMGFELGPPPPR